LGAVKKQLAEIFGWLPHEDSNILLFNKFRNPRFSFYDIVPHNNQDILLKYMTDRHVEQALDFFGIDAKDLVSIEATITAVESLPDRIYRRKDGSFLILEFDSTGKKESVKSFYKKAMLQFIKTYDITGEFHPVTVVVVYSGGFSIPSPENVFGCSCKLFSIQQISLAEVINADAFLASLKETAASGQNPFDSEENVLKLALAILG
jgi:hypothetical protein